MPAKKSNLTHPVLWFAVIISVLITAVMALYIGALDHGINNLASLSKIISGTGAVALALALSLRSLAHYFKSLRKYTASAKYFGILGFILALIYSLLLPVLNPERYFYGFVEHIFSADFILGLSAMLILAFMVAISNQGMMRRLGGQTWRKCLRLGYLAYFLLVLRGAILEHEQWLHWLQTLDTLPPPRLTITLLMVCIFALRLSLLGSLLGATKQDIKAPELKTRSLNT